MLVGIPRSMSAPRIALATMAIALATTVAPLAAQQSVRLPARDRLLTERPSNVFAVGAIEGESWEMHVRNIPLAPESGFPAALFAGPHGGVVTRINDGAPGTLRLPQRSAGGAPTTSSIQRQRKRVAVHGSSVARTMVARTDPSTCSTRAAGISATCRHSSCRARSAPLAWQHT